MLALRKYHPGNFEEFINYIKDLPGVDFVTLGSAVLVESRGPVGDGWEWPNAEDVWCFSIGWNF